MFAIDGGTAVLHIAEFVDRTADAPQGDPQRRIRELRSYRLVPWPPDATADEARDFADDYAEKDVRRQVERLCILEIGNSGLLLRTGQTITRQAFDARSVSSSLSDLSFPRFPPELRGAEPLQLARDEIRRHTGLLFA